MDALKLKLLTWWTERDTMHEREFFSQALFLLHYSSVLRRDEALIRVQAGIDIIFTATDKPLQSMWLSYFDFLEGFTLFPFIQGYFLVIDEFGL